MSDFFSSLLERATGAAPVLPRRRASIFEPSRLGNEAVIPGMASRSGLETQDDETVAADTPLSTSAPRLPQRPPNPVSRSTAEPITERWATPEAVSPTQRPIAPAATRVPAAEPTVAAENAPAPLAAQPVPQIRIERRVLPSTVQRIETIVERQVEVPPPAARVPRQSHEERESLKHPPAPAGLAPSAASFARPERVPASPVPPAPARPSTGRFAEAPLAPRRAAPSPPPPAAAERAEAPAIHISIGRIEIRATAPAAPPAAAKRAAPRLGLSDYLRSRDGGRP